MALESGTRLGHYDITAQIGQGGMGEVYRARDAKLGREVAIKVLPAEFSRDEERLARFEREARLLASLNHPNIATIHGLDEHEGTRFLVLELVEGDTLADRMAGGPVSEDEALRIALQIAAAIEAAHEKGVIHRDLKPANVKITPEGKVKVLDFGLAKSFVGDDIDVNLSDSPTMSVQGTQQGVILGTAAYMSPEQVRGRSLDKRTDVWSFGVVLYEMLTGRRLFDGDTVSDIVAAVLRTEPDWDAVPFRFRKLVRRCLERDPEKRLRHVGDIEFLLDDPAGTHTSALAATNKRPWLWPAGAALALIAAGIWCAVQPSGNVEPDGAVRLAIPEPKDIEFTDLFSVSPDGRSVAFIGNADGGSFLMIRDFDTDAFRRFDETRSQNDNELNGVPIWSPDGRFLVYWVAAEGPVLGELRRVSLASGQVQRVTAVPGALNGGFWSSDGDIVYTYGGSNGVWKVSAAGGTPVRLTQGPHAFPSPLSGRRFLYRDFRTTTAFAAALDASPEDQSPFAVMEDVDVVQYVANPSVEDTGYLVVLQRGTLSATPFDPDRLERLTGNVEVLATNVSRNARLNQGSTGVFSPPGFSISRKGLTYRTAESSLMQLAWFDTAGNPVRTYGESREYDQISLSPDGERLAAVRLLEPGTDKYDIWIHELNGPERSTPLTSWPSADVNPIWSPDGGRIAYQSYRGPEDAYDLYVRNADGTGAAELLYAGDANNQPNEPTSWSDDGRFILFDVRERSEQSIWLLSLDTNDARQYIADGAFAELSRGDRWVAFSSYRTGRFEVYVQAFDPSPDVQRPALQVSVGGAFVAHWARDGRRLFYTTDPDRVMMVVDVVEGPDGNPRVGEPRRLFDADPAREFWWDVAPDGDRFIMPVSNVAADAAAFRVVLDWTALMSSE